MRIGVRCLEAREKRRRSPLINTPAVIIRIRLRVEGDNNYTGYVIIGIDNEQYG